GDRPGVKEYFLEDLRTTRPDLADRLARRYRGAYLPAADQVQMVGPVTATVARLRPPGSTPRQWHPDRGYRRDAAPVVEAAPRPGPAPAPAPASEQLAFGS
ncbi:MAG: hypothetical protein ACRDY1_15355, partial [Acidimicrobiales bacterium]